MSIDRLVRAAALLAAAFWLVTGAWAVAAPFSFFRHVGTFPPYNRHFVHDIGAFSIGLGASLVLALARWDGLRAALGGTALASVLHEWAHVADRHLGGRTSDPVGLGVVAAIVVVAAVAARPQRRRVEV